MLWETTYSPIPEPSEPGNSGGFEKTVQLGFPSRVYSSFFTGWDLGCSLGITQRTTTGRLPIEAVEAQLLHVYKIA